MHLEWLRRNAWRGFKFTVIGVLLSLVSYHLLQRLVGHMNLNEYAAGFVRAIVMLPVAFPFSRHVTWRDRKTSLWQQFRRYLPFRLALAGLHMLLYTPLVWATGSYSWAYWTSVSITGVLNFFVGDRYIFAVARRIHFVRNSKETAPVSA